MKIEVHILTITEKKPLSYVKSSIIYQAEKAVVSEAVIKLVILMATSQLFNIMPIYY
jgi:hypothetical protein